MMKYLLLFLKGGGEAATPGEEPRAQQGRFTMLFGVVKTLIVRSLIIYFITTMFKKPATNVLPDGSVAPTVDAVPNINLFEYGTNFVRI